MKTRINERKEGRKMNSYPDQILVGGGVGKFEFMLFLAAHASEHTVEYVVVPFVAPLGDEARLF